MKDSQPARYGAVSLLMEILRTCWVPSGYNSIVLFMSSEPHPTSKSARDIFLKALEVHGTERDAYLVEACGSNAALRSRVEELLRSHRDDTFLEEPAAELSETVLSAAVALTEGPGTVIGRYKLLQQIGEGGMGVVYMAEQDQPVRRRVALKIIKVGMDTRTVVARFEAERQALALMDHPSIAKVFDAGATETGRPYFVMELVQGVPITEFCDKNKVPARERLELFMGVCQAIQSAHQKGIIHRDIKPSNVLVTIEHGEPMPKVIDFGISKATNQKLTEKTLFTQFATMIGTPAYMSPEQAEMSSLDIDTRADIYSLGVLLYELLTGTTPFPAERLRSLGFGAMQRIIVDEEPERPSTRLSTMSDEQKSAIARNRGNDLSGLGALLRGDLDWIVMRCLEKDRRRRYETANALASDLQRHLQNEPVVARPPSAVYRIQKMVTRNRGLVLATAAIAMTLVLALGFSTAALMRERSARTQAELAELARKEAKQLGEAEAVRADSVSRFVAGFFDDVIPTLHRMGQRESIQRLLEIADRLAGELTNAPSAEASLRLAVATAYAERLYQFKFAIPHYLAVEALASKGGPTQAQIGRTALLHRVGTEMWLARDPMKARELLDIGHAAEVATPPDYGTAAFAYSVAAEFNLYYGSLEESERWAGEAIRIAKLRLGPADPTFDIAYPLHLRIQLSSKRGAADVSEADADELFDSLRMAPGLDKDQGRRRHVDFLNLIWLIGDNSSLPEPSLRRAFRGLSADLHAERGLTQGLLGIAVARDGDWGAGLALMRSAANDGFSSVELWNATIQLAMLLRDSELVSSLAIDGLARFSGAMDADGARRLVEPLLLEPLPPAMASTVMRLVEVTQHGPIEAWAMAQPPYALSKYRSGDHAGAIRVIETALEEGPRIMGRTYDTLSPVLLFIRAAAQAKLGRSGEARASYREAMGFHSGALQMAGQAYRGTHWQTACTAELLRREAASLLGDEGASAVPADLKR